MQFEGCAVTGLLRAMNGARIMADTLVFTGERYERKMIVFLSGP